MKNMILSLATLIALSSSSALAGFLNQPSAPVARKTFTEASVRKVLTVRNDGLLRLQFPVVIEGRSFPMDGVFGNPISEQNLLSIKVIAVLAAGAPLKTFVASGDCESRAEAKYSVFSGFTETTVAFIKGCREDLPADRPLRNAVRNLMHKIDSIQASR